MATCFRHAVGCLGPLNKVLDGNCIDLRSRIFATENLLEAAKLVARSIRRSNSGNEAIRPNVRRNIATLETPSAFVSEIRQKYLHEEVIFRRKVKAIPKRVGGKPERPISIFNLEQRVVIRAVLQQIWPHIEPLIVPSVAYCTFKKKGGLHPTRGVAKAIKFVAMERATWSPFILTLDIERFYDNVDRTKLLCAIRQALPDDSADKLILSILSCEVDLDEDSMRGIFFDDDAGVPQGSAISPLLACAYLSPLDKKAEDLGWRLIRYVDDVILFAANAEELFSQANLLREELSDNYSLSLKEEKLRFSDPSDPVEFLGHIIYPTGKVQPSKTRLDAFAREVYRIVGTIPSVGDERAVQELISYLQGFYSSLSACDLEPDIYLGGGTLITKALRARGLAENRLTRMLRNGKGIPLQLIEGLVR